MVRNREKFFGQSRAARDTQKSRSRASSDGIELKKHLGQHFLRDSHVTDVMTKAVSLTPDTCVLEIGCGDGFLTRAILAWPITLLWVFEIDSQWANYVAQHFPDNRMTIFQEDILEVDFNRLKQESDRWTVLANLPYQITFPILRRFVEYRHIIQEGVVMIQQEVADKLCATPGSSTHQSIFFQYYFELKSLLKISPGAFHPPPNVYSRLLYFKPRADCQPIEAEHEFWQFVKLCFRHRRRTLKNNIAQTHYSIDKIPERFSRARAQELSLDNFLELWQSVRST